VLSQKWFDIAEDGLAELANLKFRCCPSWDVRQQLIELDIELDSRWTPPVRRL